MKYSTAKEIIDELQRFSSTIKSYNEDLSNHPLLVKAEESGSEAMTEIVAHALLEATTAIDMAISKIEKVAKLADGELDENALEEMAAIATEFDKSGDPLLMKQASVLDQILLSIGAPKGYKNAFKLAEDKEIEKLREKYRAEALERSYKGPKEEHDKDMKVADSFKAIENSVKEYRPLEAPLSTRTCPDHPGSQMQRVADYTYQCSLDKKVYNYLGGFTTMKGNKIPGGDIATQTQSLGDRAIEHTSFDTRESKLNG